MKETAYLGIGSNVDPERHVAIAVRRLDATFDRLALSPMYRSRAVGFEGEDFINAVARIDTDLSPQALRAWLRALEDEHGRRRDGPKFSDRVLDVDIILFGDREIDEDGLKVPRPELFHFAHVLRPLADLAPDRICPGDGRSFREIHAAAGLDESGLSVLDRRYRSPS